MAQLLNYLDVASFTLVPYVALFTFFLVSIQRYRAQTFSFSSLSSQLLENKRHFWALVPFHYGILVVLGGHIVAFLIPRSILLWNGNPLRLYVLEITALACGILATVGLIAAIARRLTDSKVRKVTSPVDAVLYLLLAVQFASGIAIAILYPWGSSWFATSMTPYLWSLLKFSPDLTYIVGMPHLVKLHVFNAFVVFGLFPFTRLVHILVVPNPYLWRKPQVVRWYGAPRDVA
ncbi:MAG: respiratory nitrate reductase subunit gamma [Candidatus Hydrogenedentes bacterium]|nr:respiratory nitrate reductase subunit gamma [Candidatus Hydrogenedentota bacterium]